MHRVLGYNVIERVGSGRGEYWYCSWHETMKAAREEIARMKRNSPCHRRLRIKKERCWTDEDRHYWNPESNVSPGKMGRILCYIGEWKPQHRYSSGRQRGERKIDIVRYGEYYYQCIYSHTSTMRRKPTRKLKREMWKQMEVPRMIEANLIIKD